MFRIGIAALAFLMLAACATQQTGSNTGGMEPVKTGNEYGIYKIKRGVTVRAGPFLGAKEQGVLQEGDRLRALLKREGDNWTRVRMPDGRDGYVFGYPFVRLE